MQQYKQNRFYRVVSCLLIVTILCSICPMAIAAERTLSIETLEELHAFAKHCASDTYSKGLLVVLDADIDANGAEVSIPIFCGTFDGQGHKISNVCLNDSATGYGLFSRVEKGAVIQNLSVVGEVSPAGTQSKIGGIVGENDGDVINCSFSGMVHADAYVGGIAGYNGESGVITDCSVSGMVHGVTYTGGIAGYNTGVLLRCTNTADINTVIDEANRNTAELENIFYHMVKKEDITEYAVTTDSGGIAGYSTGVVQSCTNTGTVGFSHVGYNVGGIVGRQNGYIANCSNQGVIQGRKDVGGIVGQMVPDVTLQFSMGDLDQLRKELDTLQGCINRLLEDAQSASDTLTGRVSRISLYADTAGESAHSLSEQLQTTADETISTVNQLVLLVERYMNQAVPIVEELCEASNEAADAIIATRHLLADLEETLVYNEQLFLSLEHFCAELNATCDALNAALDALEQITKLLGKTDLSEVEQIRSALTTLREAVKTLEVTISRALEEIGISGTVTKETVLQMKEDLNAVLDSATSVVVSTIAYLKNIDFDALHKQNETTIRQVLVYMQDGITSISSAVSHFGTAMEHLETTFHILRNLNPEMETILDQAQRVMHELQQSVTSLSKAISKAAQWVRAFSDETVGSISPLGNSFRENGNALNTSLNGISQELSTLNQEISAENTILLSDVRNVNDQFVNVMNLFLNALSDTQNSTEIEIIEDISEKELQRAVQGKVLGCTNYGTVYSDRNAGGIAGAMAIEYDFDPEDDFLTSESHVGRLTYQTKAILLQCNNYGTVQVKKSCAGGIVGRMDIGIVSNCGGWGCVTSESGSYVGGVAGLSLSSIRNSYAKCDLSGDNYVGGIAGSGNRITDCVTMVEITACKQYRGAIAGEVLDTYSKNHFVSDTLAGVDRVSLSGKADEITYDTLCKMEQIPENFQQLTLRFVVEDEIVQTQPFAYGASFTADSYPNVPEREGYYVQWDKTDLTNLQFDTNVTAAYVPYVTTLASDAMYDGRAAILVEGKFREGDVLQAAQREDVSSFSEESKNQKNQVATWLLQIPDDGQRTHMVRWQMPTDHTDAYIVYVETANGWVKANSERIGSYLCFELADSNCFTIVSDTHVMRWMLIIVVFVFALGSVCGVVLYQKRHKKPIV